MPTAERSSQRPPASWLLFAATALTLLLALFLGGGQGSLYESLLSLAGLALIAAAAWRLRAQDLDPGTLRWLVALPLAVVALPILQRIPLPPAIWTQLPGRGALVADLLAAGVTPGWAPLSLDPAATERILYSSLVPIGLFLAAASLRGRDRRRLVGLALAFAGLSALVGLWQLMEGPRSGLYFYEITNRGSAVGFFANRNHLASLLAASLPVTAGLLADRLRHHPEGARDARVWLLTTLMIVLAVGVTATASRAGFAFLMLSIVAGAAVLWRGRRAGAATGVRTWIRIAAAVAGVLILQSTLYAVLLRLQTDPLDDYRFAITPRTLAAAMPAAGVGYGLGTFVHAYDEVGDVAADMPPYVNHAHNDYAELWLEGGLPALVLALGAVALLLAALVQVWRQPPDSSGHGTRYRGLKLGAAFALAILLLHSGADYPLRTLSLSAWAALLAAVVLLQGQVSYRPSSGAAR